VPINAYFHGHGEEVLADMKKKYGKDKGERVFYATAKKGEKPNAKSAGRRRALSRM